MIVRNNVLSILFASLPVALHAQQPGAEAKVRHLDPRPLALEVKVSLTQAIRTALRLQPGTAVQAEIEGEVAGESTHVFYEVMVIDKDGHPFEVLVDPQSGEGKVKVAQEPAEEIAAFRILVSKATLPLETLIESAGKLVRGKAMEAKLELDDDAVEASIVFSVETYGLSVVLDATSGKLEEIEAEPASKGDKGDEDEEGDEKQGEPGKAKNPGKATQDDDENEVEEKAGKAKGKQAG